MAKIQTIKNSESTIIYPQTHTKAVFDADNIDLQTHLDAYLKTEDVGAVENISDIPELQTNKVTTVDENSTDVQYPSAKAVYDAIINNKEVGVQIEIFATKEEIISPNTTTIYLIGSSSPYEEYLYLGNNKWELIGTTKVDLSDYYTKTESDEKYAKLSLYSDTTINIGRKANTTIGSKSVAEGNNTTASGTYSHAEGGNTTASGSYSHAEGDTTKASGAISHAEGLNTKASNSYSHAEGNGTTASGVSSHAEGSGTTASKEASHAEGYNVTANGRYSHAEGNGTTTNDQAAHAEGQQTIAWGPASHTEGDNTRANGQAGHAEGYYTISEFMSQHVQGEYNIADPGSGTDVRGTYAHIVGNGAGDIYRSNAHTLDWYGNAWFEGSVYVGSTSGTNKDEGSKKLATEEYADNRITYGTTTLEDGVSELATGTLYVVYEE